MNSQNDILSRTYQNNPQFQGREFTLFKKGFQLNKLYTPKVLIIVDMDGTQDVYYTPNPLWNQIVETLVG
jgi:hypothetical protein